MIYPELEKQYQDFLNNHSLKEDTGWEFIDGLILNLDFEKIQNTRLGELRSNVISDLFQIERSRKMKKLYWERFRKLGITREDVGIIKWIKK